MSPVGSMQHMSMVWGLPTVVLPIIVLFKMKPDATKCKDHRTINLLTHASKILLRKCSPKWKDMTA